MSDTTTLNQQIRLQLEEWAEPKLKSFSSGLIPGEERILGVRLPKLRMLAKKLAKGDWQTYLREARDDSLEEILLQGMTLGNVNADFDAIEPYLTGFLPKIDNWSVCDSTCASLKVALREPERVWEYLLPCLRSEEPFRVRFGVVMLLDYFLTEEYIDRVLQELDGIRLEHYYVRMAVAWNLSMCYVKFPERTEGFLEENHLDDWTYNKAIQKIMESRQVSGTDKARLRNRKR